MGFPIRHIFLYIFLFAYLATSSLAQLVSSLLPPTPTSSAAVQTHTISVGNGDHKFRPDVTQAEIGDVKHSPLDFQLTVDMAVDHRVSILSPQSLCRTG